MIVDHLRNLGVDSLAKRNTLLSSLLFRAEQPYTIRDVISRFHQFATPGMVIKQRLIRLNYCLTDLLLSCHLFLSIQRNLSQIFFLKVKIICIQFIRTNFKSQKELLQFKYCDNFYLISFNSNQISTISLIYRMSFIPKCPPATIAFKSSGLPPPNLQTEKYMPFNQYH